MLLSANVYAAGTPVGTNISNTATVSYDVASVPQTPINSNTESFVVDNKIDLTVTTLDGTEVGAGAGQSDVFTRFLVTNLSNSPQDYALTSTTTGAGIANPFGGAPDSFDPTTCTIHVEDGGAVGYQVGQDLSNFINELAPDASIVTYLVCNIPPSALAGQVATVALTATTRAGGTAGLGGTLTQTAAPTAGVDIVFADTQAPLAGVAGDSLRDAAASAASAYKIGLSVILTKSVVCAPTPSCTLAFKTGDTVTYQIVVNVTGPVGSIANNLIVNDPIPTDLTYVPASIKVDAATRTDATDADNAEFSSNTVKVNFGNVTVPVSGVKTFIIQFKAVVN